MTCISYHERIWVTGHAGLLGGALLRELAQRGYRHLITCSRPELDLRDGGAVARFLAAAQPSVIFAAAARVGGIWANSQHGADFLHDNLQMQNSVIWGAHQAGVRRLIFLGSSCIYPREAAQPLHESALLSGPLEVTNRPYAIAKIAGLELVSTLRTQYGRDYLSVMPTNLYGPGDNFHPRDSHVLPALIRRIVLAEQQGLPEVVVWGSGTPRREFMHVADCAAAIVWIAEHLDSARLAASSIGRAGFSHVNVGSGHEVSIRDAAELIVELVGYRGRLRFDPDKPDGTPRKRLDCSLLNELGFRPRIDLRPGLAETIAWFRAQQGQGALRGADVT
jgi:nucleoside-diphosphate-sugar epimerase